MNEDLSKINIHTFYITIIIIIIIIIITSFLFRNIFGIFIS